MQREDWREFLPASLRSESLDPFRTLPETRVKDVDILMKFYLKTAIYASFPWQPPSPTNATSAYYVPLIFQDVVLFHATLQLSAWRLQPRGLDSNFAFLAAECIRLLKDRVENENETAAIKGETISTVATLAGIEHERENTKMLRMHLDGLKRMVDIRGGLNLIRESNPMVANSVFWAFGVALYEVPYPNLDPVLHLFFPDEHNLALPTSTSIFQHYGPAHEEHLSLDLVKCGVDPSIAVIVNSIQHASQLLPTNAAYPTASTSISILTRMCTLLSYLLSLSHDRLHSQRESLTLISEIVRIATLLHVLTPWRGLPPDGTLTISHLLHFLMQALKQHQSDTATKSSTLLLWTLSVGGVSAGQAPERAWFVSHIVEMTERLNISTWKNVKSHVSRVIWHERLCEKSHQELWEEVIAKREELDLTSVGTENWGST